MLDENSLEELLEIFLERTQGVVEEYLIRMGDQIREIGELIPGSVNRLVQLKKMNANLDAVKREIARLAEISTEDLQRVFEAAAKNDARFVADRFGNEFRESILENEPLKRILRAQLDVTLGEMANLSRTTIRSEEYRNAIDKAVQAAQMGVDDYNSAIRRALGEAAEAGLRVEIGKSGAYEKRVSYGGGYSRRLDSAVRQNVLDGIRSLNNEVLRQVGEEYGADGVELSAHMLCAEDHLPYQGRQFTNEKFAELQEELDRPFGMWNCKHTIFPILVGISEPTYTEEELEEFRKNSSERIEIDGVTKTRYQWTQEQRRIETAVRRQKDVAIAAKAAGDAVQRRKSQDVINALMDRYDKVTEAAGLHIQYGRMRVDGFKAVSQKELKKYDYSDKLESIKRRIRSDNVNKAVNPEKQRRHIRSEKEYETGRSYIYGDLATAQDLVDEYSGTGQPKIDRNGKWKNKEVVEAETDIGVDIDKDTGNETTTNRFVIHYSRTGTHIVPTTRKETDNGE